MSYSHLVQISGYSINFPTDRSAEFFALFIERVSGQVQSIRTLDIAQFNLTLPLAPSQRQATRLKYDYKLHALR